MSELFAGKYQLKKRLGVGGMAEVWLAELKGPQGFSRQLVIKRILPHLADDENFITMFEDEARLAARLNHPHAVRVEEFAQAGDVWYLAMEYLDGGDLRNLTRRALTLNEQVPMQVLLQMGGDVASALHHAHTLRGAQGQPLNMIHRDVSPHNILVTTQGQAKLVDFGIARAESNQVKTRTGMVKGKSGYMSPEQALGRTLDGRSDQFALAIVLYETALQVRVFQGDGDLAIMRKVVACEIPPLAALDPNIPLGFSEVLEKALQRAPEERFSDCHAFAQALFDCLDATGFRGGHQPIAEWVQRMAQVQDKLAKLPGLDEMRLESGLIEEVTKISRSRSSMQPSLKSQAAAGQLLMTGSHTMRTSNRSNSILPLLLGGGLLVVGIVAFALTSGGQDELPADVKSATQSKPDPLPEESTLRVVEEPTQPSGIVEKTGFGRPTTVETPKAARKTPKPKAQPKRQRAPEITKARAKLKVKIRKRGRPQDWGLVYVDGKARRGDNPEIMLRVGKHRICVVNQEFGIAWRQTVNLPAAGSRLYVDMNEAKPGSCP
jgi:serine/threonine protein kinase